LALISRRGVRATLTATKVLVVTTDKAIRLSRIVSRTHR
jgi:hypothetical protein